MYEHNDDVDDKEDDDDDNICVNSCKGNEFNNDQTLLHNISSRLTSPPDFHYIGDVDVDDGDEDVDGDVDRETLLNLKTQHFIQVDFTSRLPSLLRGALL